MVPVTDTAPRPSRGPIPCRWPATRSRSPPPAARRSSARCWTAAAPASSTRRPSGSCRSSDDAELVAATREVLARPVDLVVATTGVGFRGWLEAADAWDLPLVEHLRAGARAGPRPQGARRDPRRRAGGRLVAGVGVVGRGARPPAVRRRGPARGTPDRRPAARRPAARPGRRPARPPAPRCSPCRSTAGCCPRTSRRCAGWSAPIVAGGVDAVTFTSAPAAASLLTVADELGAARGARRGAARPGAGDRRRAGDRRAAGRGRHPAPSSPSAPGSGRWPARWWPGCPSGTRCCRSAPHTLQVRGHAAVLDGRVVELAPGPMAVLRALARRPGAVVSRPELVAALPGGGDGHAVEMAVTRLRAALGAPRGRRPSSSAATASRPCDPSASGRQRRPCASLSAGRAA